MIPVTSQVIYTSVLRKVQFSSAMSWAVMDVENWLIAHLDGMNLENDYDTDTCMVCLDKPFQPCH